MQYCAALTDLISNHCDINVKITYQRVKVAVVVPILQR